MKILSLSAVGLHLGYLGCYGNEWIATPNFDRLAADSVVFDRHYAESPGTDGSVISPNDWFHAAVDAMEDLKTRDGLVAAPAVSFAPPWRMPADMAAAYTEDDDVEPWPAPPAGPCDDEELILRAQDTYAALVTWFDAQLGELLDRIAAEPWGEQLMLVVSSASGYPLGEHGQIGWASPNVFEEAVHVPLLIRFPGREFAGMRIGALTSDVDLAAAVDDWSHGRESGFDKLLRGTVDSIRPHVISRCGTAFAVRTLDWALIRRGEKRELFVKPDDRWEVNDIAGGEPDAADELDAVLK